MVKDKNGREIKIGDKVHYKRSESSYGVVLEDGRTKTIKRPARDVIFTVDDFVSSPFFKYGGNDPRLRDSLMWITGSDLPSISRDLSYPYSRVIKNSVSPLAVVKIDTSMVKRNSNPHSFK